MTRSFLFFLLIATRLHAAAQSSVRLEEYFAQVRAGTPVDASALMKQETSETVIMYVVPYLTDTVPELRSAAYRLTHLAGITAREGRTRQQATHYLVQGFSGSHGSDTDLLAGYLKQFGERDFGSAARDSLRSLIKMQSPPQQDLLKLAGYLDMRELEEDIQRLSQPGNSQRVRWAALLALSRMGDAAALDNVLTRVKKLKINEDLVYDIFPDLIYTRQKPAIHYMVDIMKSNSKDCFSADAEQEVAIPCGYRIMEQLAPVIRDYPLKLDVSGDVKTKNYADALGTVRTWFDKHPEFVVTDDTY